MLLNLDSLRPKRESWKYRCFYHVTLPVMTANMVQLEEPSMEEPFVDILKYDSNGTMWCRMYNTIS